MRLEVETPVAGSFDPAVFWLAKDSRLFIPAVAIATPCRKRRLSIFDSSRICQSDSSEGLFLRNGHAQE
jgi:hypothetical protein